MPYRNGVWVADYGGQYGEQNAPTDAWNITGPSPSTSTPTPTQTPPAQNTTTPTTPGTSSDPMLQAYTPSTPTATPSTPTTSTPVSTTPATSSVNTPAYLSGLQEQGASGLSALLGQNFQDQWTAQKNALWKPARAAINTAADRQLQQALEGTFGRGVGSSTISVELQGRLEQERLDALARAKQSAISQAGQEVRADIASQLGLNQGALTSATQAIQAGANIDLAQAAQNQAAQQFAEQMGFSREQLAQQASQFGQNLQFQGGENALNRALQTNLAQMGFQNQANILGMQQSFQGAENQLNRDAQMSLANLQGSLAQQLQQGQINATQAQYIYQGELQKELAAQNQSFQQMMLGQTQDWTGGQNELQRQLQLALQTGAQDFTAGQNELQRQLQMQMFTGGQDFTAQQNQLNRQQQMDYLTANQNWQAQQNDINRTNANITGGASGLLSLIGYLLGGRTA